MISLAPIDITRTSLPQLHSPTHTHHIHLIPIHIPVQFHLLTHTPLLQTHMDMETHTTTINFNSNHHHHHHTQTHHHQTQTCLTRLLITLMDTQTPFHLFHHQIHTPTLNSNNNLHNQTNTLTHTRTHTQTTTTATPNLNTLIHNLLKQFQIQRIYRKLKPLLLSKHPYKSSLIHLKH